MSSDTSFLLSARELSVRFGGVLAVNKVSFDVRRGEVFTLIGPNGAGKTTVFNLISRIYTPTSGSRDTASSMASNNVLMARGIGKTVKSGDSELVILREIDLAVILGDMVAVVGACGVG